MPESGAFQVKSACQPPDRTRNIRYSQCRWPVLLYTQECRDLFINFFPCSASKTVDSSDLRVTDEGEGQEARICVCMCLNRVLIPGCVHEKSRIDLFLHFSGSTWLWRKSCWGSLRCIFPLSTGEPDNPEECIQERLGIQSSRYCYHLIAFSVIFLVCYIVVCRLRVTFVGFGTFVIVWTSWKHPQRSRTRSIRFATSHSQTYVSRMCKKRYGWEETLGNTSVIHRNGMCTNTDYHMYIIDDESMTRVKEVQNAGISTGTKMCFRVGSQRFGSYMSQLTVRDTNTHSFRSASS